LPPSLSRLRGGLSYTRIFASSSGHDNALITAAATKFNQKYRLSGVELAMRECPEDSMRFNSTFNQRTIKRPASLTKASVVCVVTLLRFGGEER
jgi:hypothetical protein